MTVVFADQNGNVIGQGSAGRCGFKGPKKATPYAAGVIVKDVVGRIAPYGVKDVKVFVKGVGLGREAAVRALNANGINVVNIKDVGQGTKHLYQVQVEAPKITKYNVEVLNDYRRILNADPDNSMGDILRINGRSLDRRMVVSPREH